MKEKLFTIFFLFLIIFTISKVYAYHVIISLEIPVGVNNTVLYTYPNETLQSCLVLQSNSTKPLICKIELISKGCNLIYNKHVTTRISKYIKLALRGISKVLIFSLRVDNRNCIVISKVRCNSHTRVLKKYIILKGYKNVSVVLIAPSDSLCRFNVKLQKYTYVIVPSVINPILKIVSGFAGKVHPHFVGYMCVKVVGYGTYTVVILFDNGRMPISSVSPESAAFGTRPGIIILESVPGNVSEVIPLWAYVDPMKLVGTHTVKILVYPYGGQKPLVAKTYHIRIICLEESALLLVLFSGLVAVPVFVLFLVQTLRKAAIKELVMCSLVGCLIFVTAVIPSYILWGISSVLGPFDWIVWGLIYDVVRMMYYGVAIRLRPRCGTFTLIMFIVWVLSVLYFGRLSILSILWVATTAMFYEVFFLLFRTYSTEDVNILRTVLAFTPATIIDTYVDLMLYMTLYRLFYANWYVLLYVTGMSIYSLIGFIAGLKLAEYVRQAAKE